MDFEPWAGQYLHYPWSEGVSITATGQEPPVGFEPTTARLRIESSTTELRWRGPNLATCCATRYSTSALRPPSLDPFAHGQGKHRKSSYRIGPPPAEHRVQTQTEKSRRREPRTARASTAGPTRAAPSSALSRHQRTTPLVTSMTESIPNPVRATEPATRPAAIATIPSRAL